jgi:hypothetical protein
VYDRVNIGQHIAANQCEKSMQVPHIPIPSLPTILARGGSAGDGSSSDVTKPVYLQQIAVFRTKRNFSYRKKKVQIFLMPSVTI